MKYILTGLGMLFLMPLSFFANHIVGGEIYYDQIGTGTYKVTLKLYRDCSISTNPPFDDPASVMVFNANGGYVKTLEMNFNGASNVPNTINNPCINLPDDICVQEAVYQEQIYLAPRTGGYYLVYQRCCRNNTIVNLINPGIVGSTYMEHIPGPEQAAVNSSPRYNTRPDKFICNGFDIQYNHAATDPDGDSLVYSFSSPFTGLDACCPKLGTGAAPNASSPECPVPPATCPVVGNPPPYNTVPFVSPYSGAIPISSSPVINIHPQTGLISGKPNVNGQWVVGVLVKEYRNGKLIGEHLRDFQYNVTPCEKNFSSVIQEQTQFCFGLTVNFQNLSVNGISYLWNFGDPATLTDFSTAFNPTYTYPDSGKYVVTLIVNPGAPCADTSKQTVTVYPLLQPTLSVTPYNACADDNKFDFSAGGSFASYSTFNWTFGVNASPAASILQNQPGVTYNAAGDYPVKLVVQQATCTKTILDTVQVYERPKAYFNPSPLIGCEPFPVFFKDSSTHGTALIYLWDFGDGTSSTQSNPLHIYTQTGVYNVSLTIITTTGCKDTSTYKAPGLITVKPSPKANFNADPLETDFFNSTINFIDLSKDGISMVFDLKDGTVLNQVPAQHYYENFGNYAVTQIVTGSNGCPDTAVVWIKIRPEHLVWIPNAFTPFLKDGDNDVFKPVLVGATEYSLLIYDRWGNLLFTSHNLNDGWDGTFHNKACPLGVYVYKIVYKDEVEMRYHTRTGTISLVR